MSTDIDRVAQELKELGYSPWQTTWAEGTMIVIDYVVEVGSRAGQRVSLGISFQGEGYPEYPPHWILVSPPISDGQTGGSDRTFTDDHGRSWLAMSRPPSDLWDQLCPEQQNMRTYLHRHVRRIWSDV